MNEELEERNTEKTRYPMLEIIAFLYQLLAVLVIGVSLIVAANIYFRSDTFDTGVASAMGVTFITGIIGFVILWASAEIISVFIHIEENTRKTKELLQLNMEIKNKN